jgi:hypothetical protein
MEHDEAVRFQAAERYVAHELSPAERDAFEEHFFDCQECADDVRFEMTFAANARAVFREQRAERRPAPEPRAADSRGSWLAWLRPRPALAFSFAANFALAAGLGYVLLTGTHELAVPQFAQLYYAPGPTHGAEDVHAILPGETFYQVRFPAPGAASQSYSYEVLGAAGRRESSGSLKAPASEDADLYLQLPVRSLPAGVHTLVVRGGSGGEIVSWSRFRISR